MGLLFGRDAASYVCTSAGRVKETVKDAVPVTFEIDRARKMIGSLEPEIRRNMHIIAKQEVEVDRLRKQVESLAAHVDKSRGELERMKDDLAAGSDYVYYAGRRYTSNQVRTDLANRFKRAKTNDATLTNLERVLSARESSLAAGRQKLEEMLAAKRQLIVDVENLEARQKMLEVAQTASDFNFDDSRLSRTKELITDIQTRIDVAERLVNVESTFHDQIPLDVEVDEDLVAQVAAYLGDQLPEIEVVADRD
jgi:chromosome segregation ATPase